MQLSFNFEMGLGTLRESLKTRQNPTPEARSAKSLTVEARALASEVSALRTAGKVTVTWNSRLQTTAGTAEYGRCHIDLNPKLRALGEKAIDRILRHELAHLVAHERAGRRRIQPHGAEWKQACADLGIPGEKASHSLPLRTKQRQPKYAYRCPQCEEVIYRFRRMARYSACYACCKAYNNGEYHPDFAFERVTLKSAPAKVSEEQ